MRFSPQMLYVSAGIFLSALSLCLRRRIQQFGIIVNVADDFCCKFICFTYCSTSQNR